MMKHLKIIILLCLLFFISACTSFEYEQAILEVVEVRYVTHTSAMVEFNVPVYGSNDDQSKSFGICYNTTGDPDIDDEGIMIRNRSKDNPENYIMSLDNLLPNTEYYVRVFMRGLYFDPTDSKHGRSLTYSDVITIKTNDVNVLLDERDGKEYHFVIIGDRQWMAQNLAYDAGDGSIRHDLMDKGTQYWELYENDPRYGYLYNYETALNVCPAGWRLPSDTDWQQLELALGLNEADIETSKNSRDSIGVMLKNLVFNERGSSWNASNSTGFNALPGGFFNSQDNGYQGVILSGYFYSSTLMDDLNDMAIYRMLSVDGISKSVINTDNYLSVRCVKE
jgi:uncharacterized protein (TIGR02145 family)